ncbi:MAG: hypothetical protein K8S18_10925 [Desulfobacula sp.]|nr:hypothetical protein [Desulfobacula sp.]
MLFLSFIFAYATLLIAAYFYLIIPKQKKRIESENKFFKAIVEGMKTGSIATIDDVVNIYKGIAGISSENLSYRYGLSKKLRVLLVAIISKDKKILDNSLDDDIIRDWKQKITEFIQQNERISPYADVPAAERNVLSEISTFLEMNDPVSVQRKTLELAGMIQARNDDLDRIRNINKWTVPLSIIGLIMTIIFGILAWIK